MYSFVPLYGTFCLAFYSICFSNFLKVRNQRRISSCSRLIEPGLKSKLVLKVGDEVICFINSVYILNDSTLLALSLFQLCFPILRKIYVFSTTLMFGKESLGSK